MSSNDLSPNKKAIQDRHVSAFFNEKTRLELEFIQRRDAINSGNRFFTESMGKTVGICTGVGFVLGLLMGGGLVFLMTLLGLGGGFALYYGIKGSQKGQIARLRQETDRKIQQASQLCDENIRAEIERYDREVLETCRNALAKQSGLIPMVDHTVMMFERMISHADNRKHIKIVTASLTFQVDRAGIRYYYNSNYTNKKDDFEFSVNCIRDLKTEAESEGVARAVTRLTLERMRKRTKTVKIQMTHEDAKVTLIYTDVNPNFTGFISAV